MDDFLERGEDKQSERTRERCKQEKCVRKKSESTVLATLFL